MAGTFREQYRTDRALCSSFTSDNLPR